MSPLYSPRFGPPAKFAADALYRPQPGRARWSNPLRWSSRIASAGGPPMSTEPTLTPPAVDEPYASPRDLVTAAVTMAAAPGAATGGAPAQGAGGVGASEPPRTVPPPTPLDLGPEHGAHRTVYVAGPPRGAAPGP